MSNLVIVESPAKASTIKGYLGSNYKVIASKGHIRDLPKSSLGIDIEGGFLPHYINIRGKGDVISELKKEAKAASKIYLATDPDREGEAISWHIASQLNIPEDSLCRVTFNEITKGAVKDAIKHPRKINLDLVNSQQARRIIDRIVGFKLSEVLWKKVKSGLSGGRVQSVAAKIITDRERDIREFVPQEYWTFTASLKTSEGESIESRLYAKKTRKIKISNEKEAASVEAAISAGSYKVVSVKHAQKMRNPAPPFTTSTMQQEASKKLGFQAQKIMKIAQELYDGLNLGSALGGMQGLITYMRTDSIRISDVAKDACADFIRKNFGEEFLPSSRRVYRSDAAAQDAHEAIRPSNVNLTPSVVKKMLTSDQFKLYKLIWERFVASQMQSAVLDTLSVEIENFGYIFKTGGYIIKSRGYLAIYDNTEEYNEDDNVNLSKLPNIKEGEVLELISLDKSRNFTEPPARYTEASLIKFLEENGIGRPSTYAPIISIILSREYVKRDGKSLVGTKLGEITTRFMSENFPEIVDYEFTASMENQLDSIENGGNTIEGVLSSFYDNFEKELKEADSAKSLAGELVEEPEISDVPCERCGKMMVYKVGRFGKFLACPSYPECKNTKAVDKNGKVVERVEQQVKLAGFKCELCGKDMVVKQGRFGVFYACSDYPTCTFKKAKVTDTGVSCPVCNSRIVAKHGKGNTLFYSCDRYPDCDFSSWDMPLNEKCPECSEILFYRKSKKSVICKKKGCSYKREEEMTVIE